MIKVIWKTVKGFPDYQISSNGQVKSIARLVLRKDGKTQFRPELLLKPGKNTSGYFNVILYKNKIGKNCRVHRLVAEAFIHNKFNKPQINHKDGNKLNNNILNLEWASNKENSEHSAKLGLVYKGEMVHFAKLTNNKVRKIRNLYKKGDISHRALGKKFLVDHKTIGAIIARKTWKHIYE